jgi:hypothetical protein
MIFHFLIEKVCSHRSLFVEHHHRKTTSNGLAFGNHYIEKKMPDTQLWQKGNNVLMNQEMNLVKEI